MPWRRDVRPYYVLVSELMLQQTQVDRVVPKFNAFIKRFPDEIMLAQAPLGEVVAIWSGLGYNRRAKFLHQAAQKITTEFSGKLPDTLEKVQMLPGVGPGTAGAIMTYAFNRPSVFIETNVRTVYFYHFFPGTDRVMDAELRPIIETTLDREHPREFYWALMDYGAYLKKNGAGAVAKSKHYKKQSPLKGSVREVRGRIIDLLIVSSKSVEDIYYHFQDDERTDKAVKGLLADGLIMQTSGILHLTK